MRLFVACETPPEIQSALGRVREEFRSTRADVRWEPNEKLHCTLKFLGDVPSPDPPLSIAREAAGKVAPCEIVYRKAGCFPNLKSPRVVWMGIDDPAGTLTRLANDLDRDFALIGIPPEQRAFHPHITLGRVKSLVSLNELIDRIERSTFESHTVRVDTIAVIQSTLHPSGSVYKVLERFPLSGGGI
jgi:RNA 2',3'-cyclic 3'-phosphodiesterase